MIFGILAIAATGMNLNLFLSDDAKMNQEDFDKWFDDNWDKED